MTKRETIDQIVARNPSARPEFLAEFTPEELDDYLRQLETLPAPTEQDVSPVARIQPART
jgi:hypothetical protein